MTQELIPIKYEIEPTTSAITAYAGLPLYLDLAKAIQLSSVIGREVQVRSGKQGWKDQEMIQTMILLNLVGGDSVSDVGVLKADAGLGRILRHVAFSGKSRRERKEMEQRWRQEGSHHSLPSPSSIFRYLEAFHNEKQESLRTEGKAFIPEPTEGLRGLYGINRYLMEVSQKQEAATTATVDIDAMINESHKQEAMWTYKGIPGYQPVNVLWAEKNLILHSEFRDGNVPAGYELHRVLEDSLSALPKEIKTVLVRSDSAGYYWDFLRYVANEEGTIKRTMQFTVSVDITQAFKDAVVEVPEREWHRFERIRGETHHETGKEWAEVCFVPNKLATRKEGPTYRYIAIREKLAEQMSLLGDHETKQLELPFPTMQMASCGENRRFKILGIVTNLTLPGDEVIRLHWQRCGKGEEIHSILKSDLAGGQLPSGKFGANAAWWAISVLSHNLHTLLKNFIPDQSWRTKRMKAFRFGLIARPGRIMNRARTLYVRVEADLWVLITRIRHGIEQFIPVLNSG